MKIDRETALVKIYSAAFAQKKVGWPVRRKAGNRSSAPGLFFVGVESHVQASLTKPYSQ